MYIDIFLLIIVFLGAVQGFSQGILRTLFSILGIIVGFLVALKFSPFIVTGIDRIFPVDPRLSLILGFLLTLVLVIWLIRLLGRGLEKSLRALNLNFLNKLAGSVIFGLLMILLYSAAIWFMDKTNLLSEEQKRKSRSYPFLMEVPQRAQELFETGKPVFMEFWDKLEEAMEKGNK